MSKPLVRTIMILTWMVMGLVAALIFLLIVMFHNWSQPPIFISEESTEETVVVAAAPTSAPTPPDYWIAPDIATIPTGADGDLILYGKDLISHTSKYLGPKGTVGQISNGLNCQNCHLDAGSKPFGNNYSAVASTYPKFRARSGTEETIPKRVNDCFERSLNGQALANDSKEIQAIVAYINWLGTDVPKGESPKGSGITTLAFMDRAADSDKGKIVYVDRCQSCHGADGAGMMNPEGTEYTYPPLWGPHSYNDGAGLFRLSRFAGYVYDNMPLGASHENRQLTPEEAWDVAAFVNSQERPHKNTKADWPDPSKKPVDHPFGPFTDSYPEKQHKYGPFQPIADAHKK